MAQSNPYFQQLHAITVQLTDLLTQENQLLAERRPSEIARFQEEKGNLARLYDEKMKVVGGNSDLMKSLPADEVAELREATEQFQDALADNRRALLVRKTVTEGIIRAIGDEVARTNRPLEGYDSKANLGPALPAYAAAQPTTLTLDQRV